MHVDDEGGIGPTRMRLHIGYVYHLETVRRLCHELTTYQITLSLWAYIDAH